MIKFREVIHRGTEFLVGHHTGDVEARVHFATGDAYRDIVFLGEEVQDEGHAYAPIQTAMSQKRPAPERKQLRNTTRVWR